MARSSQRWIRSVAPARSRSWSRGRATTPRSRTADADRRRSRGRRRRARLAAARPAATDLVVVPAGPRAQGSRPQAKLPELEAALKATTDRAERRDRGAKLADANRDLERLIAEGPFTAGE